MKRDFSLGDRVALGSLGAVRCPRLAGKIGTIVGRGVYLNRSWLFSTDLNRERQFIVLTSRCA